MATLFRLDGRAALVTGGSRGLGAVIAEALSFAGAEVAVTSRSLADAEARTADISAATRGPTLGVEMEAADAESVEAAVAAVVERFGGLDILVNNAGILVRGPIGEVEKADFEKSLAVNVTGPWLACRAAAQPLQDSGYVTGSVLTVDGGWTAH